MIKRLILAITALSFHQLPQQAQWSDSAIYLTRETYQAGVDHTLIATSTTNPGLKYTASLMPPLLNYTPGASFTMIPDVPTQPNATIDAGLGPVVILGTCNRICWLLYAPATSNLPAAMVVH